MASSINASTSGAGGVITTADNTGILNLQSGGTTVATVSSTGLAVTGAITTNGAIGSPYTMKNRIINGNMAIDQRNAGASITPTADNTNFVVDRFKLRLSNASKYSAQQLSSSPPVGFSNYIGITSLAATSVTGSDYYAIEQWLEGFNTADFNWGTANGQTVTLSFWAYSSLTGTFGGNVRNGASTVCYPFSYTIGSANTWTKISVTISAPPTSASWVGATNAGSIIVGFSLGSGPTYQGTANTWASSTLTAPTGATNVVSTNGATLYITGVQLEVGTQATSFEWRPYSQELLNCERYFEIKDYSTSVGRVAICYNGSGTSNPVQYMEFAVTKRAAPIVSWTANGGGRYVSNVGIFGSQTFTAGVISIYGCQVYSSSLASASVGWLDAAGLMYINAEL